MRIHGEGVHIYGETEGQELGIIDDDDNDTSQADDT